MSGEKWCPVGKQECEALRYSSDYDKTCCASGALIVNLEVCGNPSARRAPVKSDSELLRDAANILDKSPDGPFWYEATVKWLYDYRAAHPEGGR